MAQSTILLVDDSSIIRKILTRLFTDAGYHAVSASSGEEALSLLDHTRPDAVLTDVLMEGMDGYELCRRIRARPDLREVPILAVTESTELETRQRGLEAGVDDFVTKDVDHAELLARVNALLAR
jgi:CheY-like chemotaxis protein